MKNILALCFNFIFLLVLNVEGFTQNYSGPMSAEQEWFAGITPQNAPLDSLLVWQERVVLHTNTQNTVPKGQLFFKAYVLTGPKQLRVSASDVLKVELLDGRGKLVNSQYHKIQNGAATGSVEMPRKMEPGQYYLRAYTRWMLNYGSESFTVKEIKIGEPEKVIVTEKPAEKRIAVFPEGGVLVAGLSNHIAVQLGDKDQKNIAVVDGAGKEVAKIQNYGNGVGTFLLQPEIGELYRIRLDNATEIELPEAQNLGYTLQMSNLKQDKAVVRIEGSPELADENVYLRGRFKGVVYFEAAVNLTKENIAEVEIPKSGLPSGIIQLQLEDDLNQVWAARPWNVKKEQLNIQVVRETLSNGKSSLGFKVTDNEGNPVSTELSVAMEGLGDTLATSTFNGEAVAENTRNYRFLEDLLVLTQQSPALLPSDLSSELPDEIKYNFQRGLEFYGQAYDFNNTLLKNKKLQMIITTKDEVIAEEVTTNSNGLFTISDLEFTGEAKIVFRTKGNKTADKLVKAIPYDYEIPPLKNEVVKQGKGETPANKSKQFVPKRSVAEFVKKGVNERLIALDEVTLVEKKLTKQPVKSVYGIEPTRTVFQDIEQPRFLYQLLATIPGITVTGNLEYPKVSLLRNSNSLGISPGNSFGSGSVLSQGGPLWIIDGFIWGNSNGIEPEMALTSWDVERIEYITGHEASIYGSRAAYGVFLIYTRNGSEENYLNRNNAQLTLEGFHDSLDFAEYQKAQLRNVKKGTSAVLYWNPLLQTDADGEARVILDIPQHITTLKLDARAITPKGKQGSTETVLEF